jgi:putative ABC transport system permease protein
MPCVYGAGVSVRSRRRWRHAGRCPIPGDCSIPITAPAPQRATRGAASGRFLAAGSVGRSPATFDREGSSDPDARSELAAIASGARLSMNTLTFAFRSLVKSPVFSLVAMLALALGIGANSAIFSMIETIFLRPLPYANPGEIVQLQSLLPDRGLAQTAVSWPRMLAVRERQNVFTDMAVSTPNAFVVTGSGDPEQVQGLSVSRNFFPLLGIEPVLGRNFLADEDRPGGAPVVLLSYGYWQKHFAGREDVVGQPLTIDGKPHSVVGVLPQRAGEFPLNQVALFTTHPYESPFLVQKQIDDGGLFYNVLARLKPGVSIAAAQSELNAIADAYREAHPANVDAASKLDVGFFQDNLVGNQRQTYAMLLIAVAAVLLIACANVANLLLARFSRRRKEVGIRFALGARRSRVIAQFLAESLMLALAGGGVGLALAAAVLPLLAHVGHDFVPRAEEISLDPAIVAFTLGISIVSGLAMGLVPAMHASMHAANDALKDSSRESTSGPRHNRFRSGLLVIEIAVAFVLLVATGLMISTVVRIQNVSAGFRTDGIFVAFALVPPAQYPARTEATANFYRRLYHRLEEIPGQRGVALSDNPPLSGNDGRSPYAVVGRPLPPPSQRPLAVRHLISPNRFAVLGIPIDAGRDFDEHDTPSSPEVIIINETMARQLFGNQSPLGRKLVTGMLGRTAEIVGVVADAHTQNLAKPPVPEMYYPLFQRPENFTGILVRTDGDPAALTASVRAALHDVDPGIPLIAPGTMRGFVRQSMADRDLTMTLLVVFAGLALSLASLGVYSVMAYSVTQRSAEIGIRMALGARSADVQKMVIGQGLRLAALGLAIGAAIAVGLTSLMAALLFEVRATEPGVYVAIAALLIGVALLASWIPSRRAAGLDPSRALHEA